MSDVFEGPGWWMASDAKWYPPEHHPDERYRARFAPVVAEPEVVETPVAERAVETPIVETPAADIPAVTTPVVPAPAVEAPAVAAPAASGLATPLTSPTTPTPPAEEFPSVELRPEPDVVSRDTSLADLARSAPTGRTETATTETAELSVGDLQREMGRLAEQQTGHPPATESIDPWAIDEANVDTAVVERSVVEEAIRARQTPPTSQPPDRLFSVAAPVIPNSVPEPSIDVTAAPPKAAAPEPTKIGHTEVELNRPASVAPPTPTTTLRQAPDVVFAVPEPSRSTALVHVPRQVIGGATVRDRVVSLLLFVGGIAMIVGSFIDWTVGDLVQTGWERGDGIVTVVTGILSASMAGPIFVGFRHAIPKAIAIICGVVAAMVLGLSAVNTVLDAPGVDFGIGFYIVAAAAALTIVAGVADQGDAEGYYD